MEFEDKILQHLAAAGMGFGTLFATVGSLSVYGR
jgi:hypothetical protein